MTKVGNRFARVAASHPRPHVREGVLVGEDGRGAGGGLDGPAVSGGFFVRVK